MDGEHAEHAEHVEGAGRGGPAVNAQKKPRAQRAPANWSALKREEKRYISEAAVRRFDAYVAENGHKPDSHAVYAMADEVCAAVREGGITLPKRTVEGHVVKFLIKLMNGGSRFEVKMRKAPANERSGDAGQKGQTDRPPRV